MTEDPADQNLDNIQIISTVVLETAALLTLPPTPEQTTEPEVIEAVSYQMHTYCKYFIL